MDMEVDNSNSNSTNVEYTEAESSADSNSETTNILPKKRKKQEIKPFHNVRAHANPLSDRFFEDW